MADLLTDKLTQQPVSGELEPRADLRALLLARKAELIGEIAEAIANQFNNNMMAITGYAELEIKKTPSGERRVLENVVSNVTRATELVQKLLSLGRKRIASPQPVELNNLLGGIRALLEQLAGEGISLVFSLDASTLIINVDPAEVEQAILSLAINARDAMANQGELTITTNLVDLTEDSLPGTENAGKYVLLSIDDTGAHKSDQNNPPLPLTNNSASHDSRLSLALAAVRAIVGTSGLVRYASEPGKGTSFKIYFPAVEQGISEQLPRSSFRSLPFARTILLVDDDEAVRVPAAEFLKMEGFKVLQARTGPEAIHVVLSSRSSLDVLITDVVMPKMTGYELAVKLLEFHPGLRVLYMSGDDRTQVPKSADRTKIVTLRKPFRLDGLKDHIHQLLGE